MLRDDEVIRLTDMLTSSGSLSSADLSLLLEMMKCLTSVAENASAMLQRGVLDLISPLNDKLVSEEEQKILAYLKSKLMQFESGSYLVKNSGGTEFILVLEDAKSNTWGTCSSRDI